ncbi:hypothetical protein MTP04_36050 [Lysinibacillus sp. PLM2]|nr:hypothetical protein MTP04_36050 [Lysinibacillus sp. PLM2]
MNGQDHQYPNIKIQSGQSSLVNGLNPATNGQKSGVSGLNRRLLEKNSSLDKKFTLTDKIIPQMDKTR